MGFLSQVRVKGKQYIYLSEYIGTSKYSTKTDVHVYGFGERKKALDKFKLWQKDFMSFPKQLIQKGYGRSDLDQWITTLETGTSPTGRSKKFLKV
ncbi:hypothetical protein QA612_09800 [Evansella sp. AB-P1]|uniref:hypothetical protein n=1 Tax=Evansella sp. AB-P1 TaxID=3037653 RepID=UPI0024202F61|nr:hypothetical protein [Evansella sp. AB-P1]MDG5787793.1 hypothetical protein [Evansella sp. AB-P1]